MVLHLWQAVQLTTDLALATCLHLDLTTPESYGDAFARLAEAGHLDGELCRRLVCAASFRDLVAHADERMDMGRVHRTAREKPADLRAFLSGVERLV